MGNCPSAIDVTAQFLRVTFADENAALRPKRTAAEVFCDLARRDGSNRFYQLRLEYIHGLGNGALRHAAPNRSRDSAERSAPTWSYEPRMAAAGTRRK